MSTNEAEFARVVRGYNPEEVDRTLTRLRRELLLTKTELDKSIETIDELNQRVDSLQATLDQVGKPTFVGLGEALAATMNAAEKQAASVLTQANADAYNIKMAIDRERERILETAQETAAEIIKNAQIASDHLADQTAADAEKLIRVTQDRVEKMLEEADRDSTEIHRLAVTEAARERATSQREVELLLAQVSREMSDLRLLAVAELNQDAPEVINDKVLELVRQDAVSCLAREENEREYMMKHSQAVMATQKYIDDAKNQVQGLISRKAELIREIEAINEQAHLDSITLREAVDARALAILGQANSESATIIASAHERGRELIENAETQVAALNSQREILLKHLKTLKTVISTAADTNAKNLVAGAPEATPPSAKSAPSRPTQPKTSTSPIATVNTGPVKTKPVKTSTSTPQQPSPVTSTKSASLKKD